MTLEVQFLGATRTVTGSKHLVSAAGRRVLLDCGLFQGFKPLRLRNWEVPAFDAASLDAVVLSHAHLDHSGYLPLLVKHGFNGRVVCTAATADLCGILLPDSARLQEQDAERANRRGYSKHHPAQPLYTEDDARRALDRFEPMGFDGSREVAPGVVASFTPAGHILGSAVVRLEAGRRSLVFSGDLGRQSDELMRPPHPVHDADYLILESTYGDRLHDVSEPHLELGAIIRRTIERGGAVIVPSFAVGRTQALLWSIHRLKAEGVIPATLPVFLNSPMATDATAIYHRYRIEHRLDVAQCEGMCHAAQIVRTVDESRALNLRDGPMVIIAGSGMATGGRVVHHLKKFLPDPANTVVFAGFQAGGTRGAVLLAGADRIRIHGEEVQVRAEVAALSNLSAHADWSEILHWLGGFRAPPQRTFLVHGEPGAIASLQSRIEARLGWSCRSPEYLERAALG